MKILIKRFHEIILQSSPLMSLFHLSLAVPRQTNLTLSLADFYGVARSALTAAQFGQLEMNLTFDVQT